MKSLITALGLAALTATATQANWFSQIFESDAERGARTGKEFMAKFERDEFVRQNGVTPEEFARRAQATIAYRLSPEGQQLRRIESELSDIKSELGK